MKTPAGARGGCTRTGQMEISPLVIGLPVALFVQRVEVVAMIYRILIDTSDEAFLGVPADQFTRCEVVLRGVGFSLGDAMRGLRCPKAFRVRGGSDLRNPRARFYFTERGWRRFGRKVAAEARCRGHVVKIVRRKNPLPSQIAYADPWQVALLPEKRKGKSSR